MSARAEDALADMIVASLKNEHARWRRRVGHRSYYERDDGLKVASIGPHVSVAHGESSASLNDERSRKRIGKALEIWDEAERAIMLSNISNAIGV